METRKAVYVARRKQLESLVHVDAYERFPSRVWRRIRATHVMADGLRLKIIQEGPDRVFCYVKMPSKEMLHNGCTHCSGPHARSNKMCRATTHATPTYIPPGRLLEMKTNKLTPYTVSTASIRWNSGEKARAGRAMYIKTMLV